MIIRCAVDQAVCIENTRALPQRVKASSVSGSALLSCGEEPCPLRLQTVFSTLSLIFLRLPTSCVQQGNKDMFSKWTPFVNLL